MLQVCLLLNLYSGIKLTSRGSVVLLYVSFHLQISKSAEHLPISQSHNHRPSEVSRSSAQDCGYCDDYAAENDAPFSGQNN